MSHVTGDIEGEKPIDVPTMMKMLMVVYNNVREDDVMDEVAEAVSDAICMLGDMRTIAQQVMTEGDGVAEFSQFIMPEDRRKLC